MADGIGGLRIVDVSNPDDPREIGTVALSPGVSWIQANDHFVYTAGSDLTLHVFDASDPTHLSEVAHLDFTGGPRGLERSGNFLYLATYVDFAAKPAVVQVIDVSDPTHLNVVAHIENSGGLTGIRILGSHLYLDGYYSEPGERYDISNPFSPSIVPEGAGIAIPYRGYSGYAGGNGYEAFVGKGIGVYDVSNPLAGGAQVGFFPQVNAQSVRIAGHRAYVPTGKAGLQIFNIQDPGVARTPFITFFQVININTTAATVLASINPNGMSTLASINWGLGDDTHWHDNLPIYRPDSVDDQQVSYVLPTLEPNTKYSVRIVATNSVSDTTSQVISFITPAQGPKLDVGLDGDKVVIHLFAQPFSPYALQSATTFTDALNRSVDWGNVATLTTDVAGEARYTVVRDADTLFWRVVSIQ